MSTNGERGDGRACRMVAGLHLGRLADVRHRLLPRLVLEHRAGSLAVSLDHATPLAADVGIDLGDGIGRIDGHLVAAWGIGPAAIWELARANLATRPDPPWALVGDDRRRLRLVSDGAWTTGWLILGHRLASTETPAVAVAVADDLLVVADRPGRDASGQAGGDPNSTADLIDPLLDVARRLAAVRSDAWPLVPLRVEPRAPFPAPLILE